MILKVPYANQKDNFSTALVVAAQIDSLVPLSYMIKFAGISQLGAAGISQQGATGMGGIWKHLTAYKCAQ